MRTRSSLRLVYIFVAAIVFAQFALAVAPEAYSVPWVASNALIPHDTWNGNVTRIKCASDSQGGNIEYTIDFGDGSPVVSGFVLNRHVIEAAHTYNGSPGDVLTARCTVRNTSTGETSAPANYFVKIETQSLAVEVNAAIDEGLWYLHKTMTRAACGAEPCGYWNTGFAGSSYVSMSAANVTAFEVNGHLAKNLDPANPYTETVLRGSNWVISGLTARGIAAQANPEGAFNPDSNGNGFGIEVNQGPRAYQGGQVMDMLIASADPTAVATTGPANVIGRSYKDIVQDMVDWYAWAQTDGGTNGGAWDYDYNRGNDNSASQWAAIGLIPAERGPAWNLTVPQPVKDWNSTWVTISHDSLGRAWYRDNRAFIWGPYATTPSVMVQSTWVGRGRGDATWDLMETFMRDSFSNETGSAYTSPRDYYYGLFSFTKSMLLHDSNADRVAEPIDLLQSATSGVNPVDWYGIEQSGPLTVNNFNGVARTLVNDQNPGGYWYAHNISGTQYRGETAWAIIMLNRTVFESGVPVAVAACVPNPAVAFQAISCDGSSSFHQDAGKTIVQWEWDLDNDGSFETPGVTAATSFPAIGVYPIKLRVTDDAGTTDVDTVNVVVSTPPLAPTADANGPYNFCLDGSLLFLDGTGSVNPDEGVSQPGAPGDTIQSYQWELNNDNGFDDAVGPQPDVTGIFTAQGVGDYNIQLKVTDTTASSFPSSGQPDLSDTDLTQVAVRLAGDPSCACVSDLAARNKRGKIQLTWSHTGAASYNVYRSTAQGGPYSLIANTTSTYSTYLDAGLTIGTTYYYVVREVAPNTDELCQSNEAMATASRR